MHRTPVSGITLRAALSDDARCVWEWRYEPESRAASSDTGAVSFADHKRWFTARLTDLQTRIYIILDSDQVAVGYVRFALEGDNAVISIALDPSARGHGIGTAAIVIGCDRVLAESSVTRVTALIKADNGRSTLAFIKAGFGFVPLGDTEGTTDHHLEYPPS